MTNILLSTDSTSDLTKDLLNQYRINVVPLHIVYDDNDHLDGVNVSPEDLFNFYEKTGYLATTAAVSCGEYINAFKPYIDKGYEVIHLNLGSALSCSYQNCCLAAQELPGLYPIDSRNLSTGSGLLLLKVAKMIEKGELSASEIAKRIEELTAFSHASFILSELDYLVSGGRCSSLSALAAGMLNIKPSIEVSNLDGSMTVGKKYRGSFKKSLENYINDQLTKYDNIDPSCVFITNTRMDQDLLDYAYSIVEAKGIFETIYTSEASCTIAGHCGPNCIGVLFMTR